ncbi:MAG: hypothetical protein KDK34_12125 [Leptospiraceae bacterium]|nr:hypothetical protein [Leptospiraceae bacterium]
MRLHGRCILKYSQQTGLRYFAVIVLSVNAPGGIYTELGDYERGVYHLERSLEGQYFVSGYTLEDLAKAHMGRRNIARAWELYKRACGTGLESACRRVYQTPSSR